MEYKKEKYKNIEITYHISDEGMFYATSIVANSYNTSGDGGINQRYPTFVRCEVDIKNKIDGFLEQTPKTYEELAEALTNNLTWTGYEDCYLDIKVCETLVGNFIKYITKI